MPTRDLKHNQHKGKCKLTCVLVSAANTRTLKIYIRGRERTIWRQVSAKSPGVLAINAPYVREKAGSKEYSAVFGVGGLSQGDFEVTAEWWRT